MKNLMLFAKFKSGKICFTVPKIKRLFISGQILITIFVFSTQNLFAQDIKEYGSLINIMNNNKQNSGSSDVEHLKSLVFDLLPKIYINDNEEKTFSNEPPVCVNIYGNSTDLLYEENQLFSQVEMITINIDNPSELNFVLDLNKLNGFGNLKYIQFLCSFKCDPLLLNNLIQGEPKTVVTVFYRISLPE
jgi:hypothetical protein